MDWWWTSVLVAFCWTVLVSLWGIVARAVANILVGVGLIAAAVLSAADGRPGWHALGLVVAFVPMVGLYALKLTSAGSAKGFAALGAILGLGATPALWLVMLISVAVNKAKGPKHAMSSHRTYFTAIAAAAAAHASHMLPPSLM